MTAREYPKIGHWTQDQSMHADARPDLHRFMALDASKVQIAGEKAKRGVVNSHRPLPLRRDEPNARKFHVLKKKFAETRISESAFAETANSVTVKPIVVRTTTVLT